MIRKHIQEMEEYRPPLSGRSPESSLLLDFNERTKGLPGHIREALRNFADSPRLHLYPEYEPFEQELADSLGLPTDQLLLTNGSDHGIEVVFRACAEPGEEALIPVPTFHMLVHTAELSGLRIKRLAHTESLQFPEEDLKEQLSSNTNMVVLCNPNSPIGCSVGRGVIRDICEAAPQAAVLVDECYFEYSGLTASDLIPEIPNLFITRSFSKTWGLASLRLGYVISHPDNIRELRKVRGPYEVNMAVIAAATAALRESAFMEEWASEINERSKPYFTEFLTTHRIRHVPSDANFILTFPEEPEKLEAALRKEKIFVRPRSGPGIENSLRFSLGTEEEMKRVAGVIEAFLKKDR